MCAILVRDTKYLLERYLRKQRRAFVRLVSEWEVNSDDENEEDDRADSNASSHSLDDTSKDINTGKKGDITPENPPAL